jgi:DNA repair protein SbcC/Rad50
VKPVRLELEGFGAFKDPTTVDFTNIELVALVGRTGSGKSTVIDAMTFALYGSVARYDDNRAVAPVINQTGTRARVRLEFELGGRSYSATRLVQRQGTGATTREARLESGDEVLASDARGMTTVVTELLGLDATQFNRTIVLPQGRFADFLHDEPGKRQETLRGLLGLDVYRDIASAARRRAGEHRARVDAIRSETNAEAAALSDERRAALVEHRDAVVAGRAAVAEAVAVVEAGRAEIATCDLRLEKLADDLALVGAVNAPNSLDELERTLDDAAAVLAAATAAVAEARERRRVADAAAAAGPDVIAVSADLTARREAVRAADDHQRSADQLAAAERRVVGARSDAAAARAEQERLDAAAVRAREAERAIRAIVDAKPPVAQLDHWLNQRRRHAELATVVDQLTADSAATASAIEPLRTAVTLTAGKEEATRVRAGASGFVHLLVVGEACPLCQHEVHELPVHHVDVAAATAALEEATKAATAAAGALEAAERAAHLLDAQLAAEQRMLTTLAADLADVATEAELRTQRDAAAGRQAQLLAAANHTAAAEAAAAAHRSAPAPQAAFDAEARAAAEATALRSLESTQRDRLAAAEWAVLALPPLVDLEQALAVAQDLVAARDEASDDLARAETAHERAMAGQRAAEAAQRTAIDHLRTTRDRVATLEPPPVSGDRLGASWQTLLQWAAMVSAALLAERERVTVARTQAAAVADAAAEAARKVGAELLGSATDSLPTLRDQFVTAAANAAADLATLDREREQLAARLARAEQLDAERAVADQLGHLLRSDGFEAWLMEAALGELIEAGGERLRELSSGQFSLELNGRDVMVRDHANADELRGARTLSGGETFLASLSLALALAEATSELAAEGAPRLDSIFLDEGFGTLDPTTLDVVASAIEELGSSGRMVAVVTHIRELAERMPVRLEVTKVGASSRVERIDG